MTDPVIRRLDDHDRRFERQQQEIADNRHKLDELTQTMFGDAGRMLRGHEERLQLVETAVQQLTANWARLTTQLDTLATVGRSLAWLLAFVGVGLIANVARFVVMGGP